MQRMWTYAAIAIFGTLGCWARVAQASLVQANLVQAIWGADFPHATLSIDLLGSFLMGFLFIETLERLTLSPALRTGETKAQILQLARDCGLQSTKSLGRLGLFRKNGEVPLRHEQRADAEAAVPDGI